jgi:RNA polymerase sigma-B factor
VDTENTLAVADETAELLSAARAAVTDAERSLLEEEVAARHLPLARRLARRYAGRGADPEDLVQVANLALVKAIRRFDADAGDFVPFATATITGELKKYFRDYCWSIRPPRRIQSLQAEISTAAQEIVQSDGTEPDPERLAQAVRADVDEIVEALSARGLFAVSSLDQPSRDGGRPLAETLADESSALETVEEWVTLTEICHTLDADDLELLRLRFFEDRTQQEISEVVGVSQMQVSRRLRKLLDKLRRQVDRPAAA